jgi:hypothetical protein
MNHIEKALKLAEKYEKLGNKELAKKFFDIAERYEKFFKEERAKSEERKKKELYG